MRVDVKERIAMIERGEVPKGYKKDNNYVIPMNWAYMNLEKIVTSSDYGTSESTNDVDGIPVLRMGNLADGKIYTKDLVYLNLTEEEIERYRLNKGDILFNRTNSYDLVGKVALFALDGDYTFASYLVRLVINKNIADPAYVNFFMNLESSQRKIRDFATKGVQQVNVNPTVLKKYFMILVPSIQEQEQIKSIIQHWDRAIELKEKLLEQKRLQKKGLMERLLTGKVRLPGFKDEWKYLKAGAIFSNSSNKKHGGIGEVLSSMQDRGIVPRSQVDIDIKYDIDSVKSYIQVKTGDFVISLRSFQGGIEYSDYEGLISPAYTVLKNKIDIDAAFYKELFKSVNFIRRLNSVIYGIRDGKQIGYDDFSTLKLPYPPQEEQRTIAKVFKVANDEMTLLQSEINQLKNQKKGLMQLLLTGKVRVPC